MNGADQAKQAGTTGGITLVVFNIISKVIPFLFLPVLTRYLSPDQYGELTTILTIVALLVVFCGLNLHMYILVNWIKLEPEDRYIYVVLALLFCLLPIFLLGVVALICSRLGLNLASPITTLLALGIILGRAWFLVLDAMLQSEGRRITHAVTVISLVLFTYFGALAIWMVSSASFEAKILSEFIGLVLILFFVIDSRLIAVIPSLFDRVVILRLRRMLRFSVPLLPHVLSLWIISSIDRLFIGGMLGLDFVGVYTAAYIFGMSIDFGHQALGKLWMPWIYAKLGSANNLKGDQVPQFIGSYITFTIASCFIFMLIAPQIFSFLVDEKFRGGAPLVSIIAAAYGFEAIRKLFATFLYDRSQTKLIALISMTAASTNIAFNLLLLPFIGIFGAAIATLLSMIVSCLMTLWFVRDEVRQITLPMYFAVRSLRAPLVPHKETGPR